MQSLKAKKTNVQIILIASAKTSPEMAQNFINDISNESGTKITLPIALDKFGDASKSFAIKSVPTSILINKNGYIIYRQEGFNDSKKAALNQNFAKL